MCWFFFKDFMIKLLTFILSLCSRSDVDSLNIALSQNRLSQSLQFYNKFRFTNFLYPIE